MTDAGSSPARRRRALILAGGGLKVAFQAGVLQVWLDEAELAFDHADGASGGCFNLAMYAQGMSGSRIAENWRRFQPLHGIHVDLPELAKLAFAPSLFTLDAYRTRIFPGWGLDWSTLRASQRSATFNYYNFSKMRLEVVEPAAMDEDRLAACVSLPMWFPPVTIDGDACIDAVFNTDANLEEAIRRGADELWIIWTVSDAGRWADGFVNNYFQIIEVAADGRLKDVMGRIMTNNAALAAGREGEFGRPITVRMLKSEVDLNYIVDAGHDRFAEAVNAGVAAGRAWCAAQGLPLRTQPPNPVGPGSGTSLSFCETMRGYVGRDERDFEAGFRTGSREGGDLVARLTIAVDDLARFVTDPRHEAVVTGTIECAALGASAPVRQGSFNLLVDTEDPGRKLMTYRLVFDRDDGRPATLVGFKDVRADGQHDPWAATTTLYVRILDGEASADAEASAPVLAAGIIRIHMLDFLAELTTLRAEAPSIEAEAEALARFGTLFLGKLWDVYASRVLPVSPV